MDPAVAELHVHHREALAVLPQECAIVLKGACADLCARMPVAHFPQHFHHLMNLLRPDIVAGVGKAQALGKPFGQVRCAVALLVHDDDLLAARGLPSKDFGNVRRRTGGVDADVQELQSRLSHQRHNSARMAGHVRHFCSDRLPTEAAVELGRIGKPGPEESGTHELRMGGERQAVPTDHPLLDRPFKPRHLLGRTRIEVVPDEPGAGRPDELRVLRVLGVKMLARRDRLRDEALVIEPPHVFRMVGEADIEMGLEDQVDASSGQCTAFVLGVCNGFPSGIA